MKTVSNIQALRGLAATGVMMAHAVGMLVYGDVPVALPSLNWGAFGVDMFFVISGFVIAWSSVPLFGRRDAVSPFLRRRLVRIVPLYWMASVAFALVAAPYGASAREIHREIWTTLQSMAFIPTADGSTAALPTGWTLFFEMGFYLCFACVLPFRRRPALLALGVGLGALGVAGSAGWLPARLASVGTLQVLEFVAGLAVAEARIAGWRVPRGAGLTVALATFAVVVAAVPSIDDLLPWRPLVWGAPAALIVGALALAPEAPGRSPLRAALSRLGDASYSIYIVHFPLFWAIGLVFTPLARVGPHAAAAYALVLMATGLAASMAVHRFVEAPVTRWLLGLGGPAARGTPAA